MRIKKLQYASLSKSQRQVHDNICEGPRGKVAAPLSIWLHRPELADYAQSLGCYCRYESSLPKRLSELAILVTAQIWDADYEWDAHVKHALAAGISKEVISALKEKKYPSFLKIDEDIVYQVSQNINIERDISDSLYEKAVEILGLARLIDLVGLLGYYSLISMTIKTFKV